jgi:tetratricopeptide (TPR) repeat protein
MTSAGRFMLGTALFERGQARDAEAQFRQVLERQPHSGAAASALAESLMYQRRYAEAATVAGSISAEGGIAAVALRTELFGRLLGADLDAADTALGGAPAAGLPGHEQALFRRWLASERGEQHAPVPVAAIPLLARMLESLLRVQDFQNFESLIGLLNETELPERERRELLAQMYLRRGFLKSAGREWMNVCEQQPDARSLVGLAQVALANGQQDTALTFADQALALDPENLTARRLVEGGRRRAAA